MTDPSGGRIAAAALEVVAFIAGMIALLEWWNPPDRMPFWQTLGFTFLMIGISLAETAVVLTVLFWRRR